MNADVLRNRSLQFARRELDVCRFTQLATEIDRNSAKTAADVHAGNRLVRLAGERVQGAVNRLKFELRN